MSHQSIPSLFGNFPLQHVVLSRPLSLLTWNITKCNYQELFFPLQCRPGYKNMQKTVLYKCKKRCTNEWNSISYNRCHSNCDLGKISLKMCVDFWNRIPICISNTCSFFKNGCWKILELKNTWKKKSFEPHYSNIAHSEKAAIFALTSGTCLRLPLPPSGDSSIVRSVY